MSAMRLNGWHRMGLLTAAVWIPLVFWQFISMSSQTRTTEADVAAAIAFSVSPILALYGLGQAVAWVRRGFRA